MPSCINCTKFDSKKEICSVPDVSPIRKCIITSLEKHLNPLKDKIICEIGCGEWSFAKDIVGKNNCKWIGIDPREYDSKGRKILRTHAGTADSIPLSKNSVDVVLANQSLEHWHEFGTTFRGGFAEIHRILKPGGILIMNFPIHLHGHPIFVNGEIHKVKRLWNPKLWSEIHFEEWRKEYHPLEKYQGWKLLTNIHINGDQSEQTSTWMMDVKATKINEQRQIFPSIFDVSIFIIDLTQGQPFSLKLIKKLIYQAIKILPGSKSLYDRFRFLFLK